MTGIHRSCMVAFLCLALTTLASCGKDGPTEPPAQVPSIINLSAQSVTLTTIGETIQITATVLDQNSSTIAGARATWTSGNTNIATVSAGGTVTAVSNGTTQIVATFNQATASATVAVKQEPASITISPESGILKAIGATVQMTAEVFDAGGTIIPGALVQWSSSLPDVATVDENGLVTAVSRGTTQVSATSGNASMLAPVSVEIPREAFSISLNISSATLSEVGQTLMLAAIVFDIDGLPIPGAPVSWSSSNPSVATVDENGLVTAVFNGTTQITAISGMVSQFARITVDISGTGPRPSADREALISFYNATDGPDWTNRTNWVSNIPIGMWHGVTTDEDGRVVELRLRDNNLAGAIPAAMGQLTELRSMDVGDNQLTGGLPLELGLLIKLRVLLIDDNRLSGSIPAEMGDMINLETWDMSANQISGGVPAELGQLRRLRNLNLQNNNLTGNIPPELGQLTGLQDIRLDNNRISGGIPPELGQWTSLQHLVLHHNQLTGAIPPELGQLESLVSLELHFNLLSGGVPSELGSLTTMKTLDLRENREMTGQLPSSLTNVNLSRLSLDNTQLCVPSDAAFQAWLARIMSKSGVAECAP